LAKSTPAKRPVWTRLLTAVGQVLGQPRPRGPRRGQRRDRVTQRATATLGAMPEVATRLLPQSVPWSTPGVVAKGTIVPAGLTPARALVRHKGGKEVEVGLPYLLRRLGGGEVCGRVSHGVVDESKRPGQALAGARALFGAQATPALLVYARGGEATATRRALAKAGVKDRGMPPTGHGVWHGAEAVRETVRSEGGKTAGIMGTLKTDK
jgi:hypothetical protein